MTACSDQITNNGGVALHHLFRGLAGDAGRIDPELLPICERRRVTGTGKINVQKSTKRGQTDRRLDGVEEAIQS